MSNARAYETPPPMTKNAWRKIFGFTKIKVDGEKWKFHHQSETSPALPLAYTFEGRDPQTKETVRFALDARGGVWSTGLLWGSCPWTEDQQKAWLNKSFFADFAIARLANINKREGERAKYYLEKTAKRAVKPAPGNRE